MTGTSGGIAGESARVGSGRGDPVNMPNVSEDRGTHEQRARLCAAMDAWEASESGRPSLVAFEAVLDAASVVLDQPDTASGFEIMAARDAHSSHVRVAEDRLGFDPAAVGKAERDAMSDWLGTMKDRDPSRTDSFTDGFHAALRWAGPPGNGGGRGVNEIAAMMDAIETAHRWEREQRIKAEAKIKALVDAIRGLDGDS